MQTDRKAAYKDIDTQAKHFGAETFLNAGNTPQLTYFVPYRCDGVSAAFQNIISKYRYTSTIIGLLIGLIVVLPKSQCRAAQATSPQTTMYVTHTVPACVCSKLVSSTFGAAWPNPPTVVATYDSISASQFVTAEQNLSLPTARDWHGHKVCQLSIGGNDRTG